MDTLRSPFYQEIPQVFYYDNIDGTKQLAGAYAQMIKYFAAHKNYTLELIQEDYYQMSKIQNKIEHEFYNISIHGSSYLNQFANISFSYPFEWSRICVMVPAEDELPRYWYVVYPFGRYIWTFLGLTVLYVAFLMKLLKHPTTSFVKNLLYSLTLVMYSANTDLPWNNIPLHLNWFYSFILIMGFILSSYYYSYLPTYNVRPVFQPFMKTIEDILKSNIKILISSNMLEELRNYNHVNLSRLEPIFLEMTQPLVSGYINTTVRSFAYVVTENEWLFVTKLQRNLIQPVYQLSNVCFGNVLITYPIQVESKFVDSLNNFILRIQQAGLWVQWQEEAFMAAISSKYYRILQDDYPVDPLNFRYYQIVWIIYFGGIIVSTICVVVEILVFKIKKVQK